MKMKKLLPVLIGFAICQVARGVSPPPDGGYAGNNTAEGTSALFNLSSGIDNTALGFQALFHDTTGNSNTAEGFHALFANTSGHQNTATGVGAILSNTIGNFNTANGVNALNRNINGGNNTATGVQALFSNTSGNLNTATGVAALFHNLDGSGNTAVGSFALENLTNGVNNIALGNSAGFGTAMGDNNIYIGNAGRLESAAIRIGIQGVQTRTFIAGISTTAIVTGAPVAVDGNGQLGVTLSSRRFKKDIKPMDRTSETILALKPVTFHYQNDATITPQFGLIAEEVSEVDPNLVVRDKQGKPYSVRYDQVNAMLLNEFLKEHKKVEAQQTRIENQEETIARLKAGSEEQQATIASLKSIVENQKKNMKSLAAHMREQDSKIQGVSVQIEMGRPAPKVVLNEPNSRLKKNHRSKRSS